jgi:CheY-like chemotaxis protein
VADNSSISILVVDDEPAIREIFSHFLERRGHKVVTVGSAKDALKSAASVEFDVIILDNILPDISGLDLVEQLREHTKDSKIILLTGAPGQATESRAAELDIHMYLSKPIRAAALIELVEAAGPLSSKPRA